MELKASVNLYTKPGNLKAFASISIDEAFVIKNLTVRDTGKGPFVSMPSYKVGNEYRDMCFPLTKEVREQLHNTVIAEYEQELALAEEQINGQKHDTKKEQGRGKQASSKSQKAGAGHKENEKAPELSEEGQDEQVDNEPVMGM